MIGSLEQDLRHITERGIGPGAFRERSLNPWEDYLEHPSGLLVPKSALPQPKQFPLAVDLFSGAGGFSLGVMRAGFKVIACVENECESMHTYLFNLGCKTGVTMCFITQEDKDRWLKYTEKAKKSRANYLKKHPKEHKEYRRMLEDDILGLTEQKWGGGHIKYHPEDHGVEFAFFGDARALTGDQMLNVMGLKRGELDCVVGGPPCQGFSISGKRNIYDPRNSLVFEYARLVTELLPKTMIFENVPGIIDMVTAEGVNVIDAFCRILEDGGMGTYDALKRSLLSSAGAGAVFKSKKPVKPGEKSPKTITKDKKNPLQTEMKL